MYLQAIEPPAAIVTSGTALRLDIHHRADAALRPAVDHVVRVELLEHCAPEPCEAASSGGSVCGLHFIGANYYDGKGFMVPKGKITSAKQLKGATVCVQSGTTTEKNLTDFSRTNKLNLKPVVFGDLPATNAAYFACRCQAYTTDASGLASIRAKEAKDPSAHVVLPDLISKEPLGPI